MSIPSVSTVLKVLLKGFEITYSPPRLSKTKLIIMMTIFLLQIFHSLYLSNE